MNPKRILTRGKHFGERIVREAGRFPHICKHFGFDVAIHGFIDGLIPPGKSESYIHTIEKYVDHDLGELLRNFDANAQTPVNENHFDKIPIWCCWWQGEEQMPELVRMCHARLKQVIPEDQAELHLITLNNYKEYVDIPEHILKKYEDGIITMTTMSDVLRFQLLYEYGGYWLDATVFFTGNIPEEYFTKEFYCQRMTDNSAYIRREACKGNWCGFSMAGKAGNVVFRYMNEAFSWWWSRHDDIVDYVLIDYLLWTGYRKIPAIKEMIDSVPNNNQDIFELYQVLNQPYSESLYAEKTKRNVMHKLTYKMDLAEVTDSGEETMYGYLKRSVYGESL